MGCDWYTIKSLSGVGILIDSMSDKYKSLLKNGQYQCYIISVYNGSNVDLKYFIFDKDSFTKTKISVPGPYEIELCDHHTKAESKSLIDCYGNNYFEKTIELFKEYFDLDTYDEPKYWNILTSMGAENYNKFDSVHDFKQYYGYP
jgi:hypothetical protein